MLGNRQSSERAIKGPSRQGDDRLEQEERQIHLPYSRHLVEEDEGTLEKGVDLCVLGGVGRGVQFAKMLHAQI